MRHNAAGQRRSRNRGNGRRGGGNGNNRAQVFDSNGPDVRIRGTAYQVFEKYTVLAKDAGASGDRILAESYLQHAEHYQRIINSWQESRPASYAPAQNEEAEAAGDDLGLPASLVNTGRAEQVRTDAELETA